MRNVGLAAVAVAAILVFLFAVIRRDDGVEPLDQGRRPPTGTLPHVEAASSSSIVDVPPVSRSAGSIVDVCGVGKVEVRNRADPLPARAQALPAALQAALFEMEGGDKVSARAVGLYYEGMAAAKAARSAAYSGSSGCRDNDTCSDNVQETAALAAQPFRQQLVTMAGQSNDPAAVALALNVCKEQAAGLNCDERVTAARWASLEPDNAAAWLHVAAEAQARADSRAVAEAIARAAAASRFDDYGRTLLSPIETSAVRSAAPVERFHAQSDITSVWLTWPDAAYAQMTKSCLIDALDDRNRSACSTLAQLIADESMMGRTLSIAIGKRTGWPAERVETLRAEQVRFERALATEGPVDQADRSTCSGLDSMQRLLTQRARGGELRDLRQRLAGAR
ncbi:MAG: hypothetical protein M3Z16_06340 [Pseudomonadota bacterium]|nr:hypothetical protein [Pseudomonadota bacterium]